MRVTREPHKKEEYNKKLDIFFFSSWRSHSYMQQLLQDNFINELEHYVDLLLAHNIVVVIETRPLALAAPQSPITILINGHIAND